MSQREFVIITDTTADLYDGYYEKSSIIRLPLSFTMNGKHYAHDDEYPLQDFYDELSRGTLVKTSQVNRFEAEEAFVKVLDEGKDLLYISFSSGMSGTYDNLASVVNELKGRYPERKIAIVDTLGGAGGEGLLVYYAEKMKQAGKSMEEIVQWIEENRLNVHHIFIVNDLANLKHSGRISTLQALLGMIVSIKPVLTITTEGKVGVLAKALGRKKATAEMIRCFLKYFIAEKNDFILVEHTGRPDEAQYLEQQLLPVAQGVPVKSGSLNRLVAGNAGYNSLAVFFLGKPRTVK